MARYPTFGVVEGVPCDQCGEADAYVHLQEASYCGDCFEHNMGKELGPSFGFTPCCIIIRSEGGQVSLCLEPHGHGRHG